MHVRLARRDTEVRDDGCEIEPARVRDAVARGHVGRPFRRERVPGTGGQTELAAGPAGGTSLLVTRPARPPSNGAGRS